MGLKEVTQIYNLFFFM